jgi:ACS family tartrate transporter-like MFS transporter
MGGVATAASWLAGIRLGWLSWLANWAAGVVTTLQSPEGPTIFQFWTVRFLLGLAEAGFFPGVIVYLTHWFPVRDRAKALSFFLIATPFAQVINPLVAKFVLPIGTSEVVNGILVHHPELWGLEGWQCLYVLWAIPAVVLGVGLLWLLTDRPSQAKWLAQDERDALEEELAREKAVHSRGRRMRIIEAMRHPKVVLLTLAYFCTVTASYGIEFFMPRVFKDWYGLDIKSQFLFLMLPPLVALLAQLGAGLSSDHFKERRYHAVVPLLLGALALGLLPFTQGAFWPTLLCFMMAFGGFKGYQPAFWSLPNLFLVEAAAAGSIGLINSVGNLGGFLGPTVMGYVKETTGSYAGSLWFLCGSMMVTATILFTLGLGARQKKE